MRLCKCIHFFEMLSVTHELVLLALLQCNASSAIFKYAALLAIDVILSACHCNRVDSLTSG